MNQIQKIRQEKGKVPDAFGRVREIQRSFGMRVGGQDYNGEQFGAPCYRTRKYNPVRDALGRYTSEWLGKMMTEAKEELRLFWHGGEHGSRERRLFAEPYRWSERLAFAGFEFEYPGQTPAYPKRVEERYPKEELVRLFVLLSDFSFENVELIRHTFDGRDMFDDGITRGRLVQMLNQDALRRLVHSIDGKEIAKLLIEASQQDISHDTELVGKIAETFGKRHIYASEPEQRLGDYLILTPSSRVICALKHARGRARTTVEYLIGRLEEARWQIQEALDALQCEAPDP